MQKNILEKKSLNVPNVKLFSNYHFQRFGGFYVYYLLKLEFKVNMDPFAGLLLFIS